MELYFSTLLQEKNMEWLQTLRWIIKGGEKSLIAFIAFVGMVSFLLPLDAGVDPRMDTTAAAQQAGK